METIQGALSATGRSFGIVVSRFNSIVTGRLLDGAMDCLLRHDADEKAITVVYCPGSFEIPQVALQMANTGRFDAIIALGCVVRGETPHFDYIASETAKGIAQVAMQTGVPTAFGVLTTETLEQALERAGAKSGNKGWDAALTAIGLVQIFRTPTIRGLADAIGGRAERVVAVSVSSHAETLELTRYAEQAGADAVLVITPYYNRPSQQGLFQHFDAVAKVVGVPVILYNIPGRTAVNLEIDTVARLREANPNVDVWVWSDMLDPNHNAQDKYYLVQGDFTGSWNHVPKDLVMAVWGGVPREKSLRFFTGQGFQSLVACYYDADDLKDVKRWIDLARPLPKVRGFMYTPWTKKYDLLPDFAQLRLRRRLRGQRPQQQTLRRTVESPPQQVGRNLRAGLFLGHSRLVDMRPEPLTPQQQAFFGAEGGIGLDAPGERSFVRDIEAFDDARVQEANAAVLEGFEVIGAFNPAAVSHGDRVVLLGGGGGGGARQQSRAGAAPVEESMGEPVSELTDDDIPF